MSFSDVDCYIGEIRLFAGNYAPRGWALCNGQVLALAQNTPLFSILGTRYGGDGQIRFHLPNLAPLADANGHTIAYIICLDGLYPARD